jgi:hypothetical protein
MLTKNKPLLFFIFGIEITAGIILLVLGFLTDPKEMLDKDMPLQYFFFLLGTILFIGPFIAGTALYFIGGARARMVERLKKSGLHGTATIVSISSTGRTIKNIRRMDFVLDVNVPGKIPYRVEHYEHFHINHIDNLKQGAVLKVLVDPDDQNKIMIVRRESSNN